MANVLDRLRELDERVLGSGFYSLDQRWARGDPPGRPSSDRLQWFRSLDNRVLGPVTRPVPNEPQGQRARELWAELDAGVRDQLGHAAAFGRVAQDPGDALIVADLISGMLAKTRRWSRRFLFGTLPVILVFVLLVVFTSLDAEMLLWLSAGLVVGFFGNRANRNRLRNVRDANLAVAGADG